MKKLLITFLSVIMVMVFMPTMAFAANDNVAKIGDKEYATLAAAVEEAEDGDTIELLNDTTANDIRLTKSLTFNLNGKTITGTSDATRVFLVQNKKVSATFNGGVIEVTNVAGNGLGIATQGGKLELNDMEIRVAAPDTTALYNYGIRISAYNTAENGEDYNRAEAVINNTKVIETGKTQDNGYTVGIAVMGANDKDDSDAYIESASVKLNNVDVKATAFALSGNGAAHSTNIEVRNSNLTSIEGAAIYHPQAGTMNVYGGTITGATGIEIRGGNVNVSGGTKITATADPTSVDPNGNGTTSTGAAIAVSQHTTKLPISVTIDGAELTGASALVANNPQNNSAEDIAKVEVIIENGQFTGLVNTNEGGKIEAAGGTFDRLGDKVEVTAADVAEITENDGSVKTVVGLANINETIKDAPAGTKVRIVKAAEGSKITAPAEVTVENTTDVSIEVNEDTLDAGQTITVEKKPETENPPAGDNDDGNKNEEPEKDTVPKTSDVNNMFPWIMAMALAAGAAAMLKRKED